MNRERLLETLRRAEGYAPEPYWDVSQWTGGYGHKLPASWPIIQNGAAITQEISPDQAETWLAEDAWIAWQALQRVVPNVEDFSDRVQEALCEMLFNIGEPRFKGFKLMIAALLAGDLVEAANQMEDSKWFGQVGRRGARLVQAVREG